MVMNNRNFFEEDLIQYESISFYVDGKKNDENMLYRISVSDDGIYTIEKGDDCKNILKTYTDKDEMYNDKVFPAGRSFNDIFNDIEIFMVG